MLLKRLVLRTATCCAMVVVVAPMVAVIGVLYVVGLHEVTEKKLEKFLRELDRP